MRLRVQRVVIIQIFILIAILSLCQSASAEEIAWVVEKDLSETTPPIVAPPTPTYIDQEFRSIEAQALRRLSQKPKQFMDRTSYVSPVPQGMGKLSQQRPDRSQVRTQAPQPQVPQPQEFVAEIFMDQNLWAKQPNTSFEIPFHKSIILKARNIKRFLVLEEGFLRVDKVDPDTLIITSTRRGPVLMHVWDDAGRWTFQMMGVLPPPTILNKNLMLDGEWVQHNEHWTFSYSNNWNSFYVGDSVDDLDRTNINFVQNLSFDAPTPYGDAYGFVSYFKFADSIERTGQGLGLVDGKIGPLKDFSVYGYDTSKRFSELSLPGRYFRGVRWDQDLFNHQLAYSFIYGKDRSNFRVISPGITDRQESFITGAKVVLFPDSENNYSINFARGFGEERPDELKPKVWSGQINRRIKDWYVETEVAHDEDDWAMFARSEYDVGEHKWNLSARNFEDNFATITNFPGDRGEAGAVISYDWLPEDRQQRYFANLDFYRDRDTFNPKDRKAMNYDFGTGYNYNFNRSTSVNNSLFYAFTPQLISPRKDLRLNSTLSHSFKTFYDRAVNAFVTGSYQRSRYELTSSSEFDRYSVTAGFRLPLVQDLNFYTNYQYSWVDVRESGESSNPRVLSAGISYAKNITDKITTRTSVTWRDEKEAGGSFSFLSGTDTLRGNLSVAYRPKEDMEIFMDTTVRNVLAEVGDDASFNDADVRFGVRTTWDLMFGWDPSADVTGYVYKDINQNGYYDEGEPGIEHIVVRVGDERATTDYYGRYFVRAKGKEVKVALELDSLPKGFNVTTKNADKIIIKNNELHIKDFGLFSRARIYGTAFADVNNNGRLDSGEQRIPRVAVTLDGSTKVGTDFEGLYQFNDVAVGTHTLTVDINSIPFEFLPTIKLKHEINVEEGGSATLNIPLKVR